MPGGKQFKNSLELFFIEKMHHHTTKKIIINTSPRVTQICYSKVDSSKKKLKVVCVIHRKVVHELQAGQQDAATMIVRRTLLIP